MSRCIPTFLDERPATEMYTGVKFPPDATRVVVSPNLHPQLLELNADFILKLQSELSSRFALVQNKLDDASPMDQFVFMILQNAHLRFLKD